MRSHGRWLRTCWTTSTVLTVKSVSKDGIETVSTAMLPRQGMVVQWLRCSHMKLWHADWDSAVMALIQAGLISS